MHDSSDTRGEDRRVGFGLKSVKKFRHRSVGETGTDLAHVSSIPDDEVSTEYAGGLVVTEWILRDSSHVFDVKVGPGRHESPLTRGFAPTGQPVKGDDSIVRATDNESSSWIRGMR
jgi:hypothetical protein